MSTDTTQQIQGNALGAFSTEPKPTPDTEVNTGLAIQTDNSLSSTYLDYTFGDFSGNKIFLNFNVELNEIFLQNGYCAFFIGKKDGGNFKGIRLTTKNHGNVVDSTVNCCNMHIEILDETASFSRYFAYGGSFVQGTTFNISVYFDFDSQTGYYNANGQTSTTFHGKTSIFNNQTVVTSSFLPNAPVPFGISYQSQTVDNRQLTVSNLWFKWTDDPLSLPEDISDISFSQKFYDGTTGLMRVPNTTVNPDFYLLDSLIDFSTSLRLNFSNNTNFTYLEAATLASNKLILDGDLASVRLDDSKLTSSIATDYNFFRIPGDFSQDLRAFSAVWVKPLVNADSFYQWVGRFQSEANNVVEDLSWAIGDNVQRVKRARGGTLYTDKSVQPIPAIGEWSLYCHYLDYTNKTGWCVANGEEPTIFNLSFSSSGLNDSSRRMQNRGFEVGEELWIPGAQFNNYNIDFTDPATFNLFHDNGAWKDWGYAGELVLGSPATWFRNPRYGTGSSINTFADFVCGETASGISFCRREGAVKSFPYTPPPADAVELSTGLSISNTLGAAADISLQDPTIVADPLKNKIFINLGLFLPAATVTSTNSGWIASGYKYNGFFKGLVIQYVCDAAFLSGSERFVRLYAKVVDEEVGFNRFVATGLTMLSDDLLNVTLYFDTTTSSGYSSVNGCSTTIFSELSDIPSTALPTFPNISAIPAGCVPLYLSSQNSEFRFGNVWTLATADPSTLPDDVSQISFADNFWNVNLNHNIPYDKGVVPDVLIVDSAINNVNSNALTVSNTTDYALTDSVANSKNNVIADFSTSYWTVETSAIENVNLDFFGDALTDGFDLSDSPKMFYIGYWFVPTLPPILSYLERAGMGFGTSNNTQSYFPYFNMASTSVVLGLTKNRKPPTGGSSIEIDSAIKNVNSYSGTWCLIAFYVTNTNTGWFRINKVPSSSVTASFTPSADDNKIKSLFVLNKEIKWSRELSIIGRDVDDTINAGFNLADPAVFDQFHNNGSPIDWGRRGELILPQPATYSLSPHYGKGSHFWTNQRSMQGGGVKRTNSIERSMIIKQETNPIAF